MRLITLCLICVFVIDITSAQSQDQSRPIKLTDLKNYISEMDKRDGFKTEFNRLGEPQKQLKPWNYALNPQNVQKHRYQPPEDNLLTYDETRVILYRTHGDYFSDFINANWVDNYKGERRYIATQCPIDSTISDFWRMVWQYNVHEIVMLANPHDMEKNKCAKYFPDNTTTFGEIEVSFQRKMIYPDIVVRIYALRRGGSARVLAHHHFVSWPDLGVPSDPKQLLNLIKKYRDSDLYTRSSQIPILVHCSAGVGRTGTFLLTDSMYEMAMNEDHVDFLKHLHLIRNQRVSLVEKPEQYALAHRVVSEAYDQGLFRPVNNDEIRQPEYYNPASGNSTQVQEVKAEPADHNSMPKKQRNVFIIDPNLADQDIVIRISSNENSCSSTAA